MDKNEKNRQEKRQTDLNTDDIFKQEKSNKPRGVVSFLMCECILFLNICAFQTNWCLNFCSTFHHSPSFLSCFYFFPIWCISASLTLFSALTCFPPCLFSSTVNFATSPPPVVCPRVLLTLSSTLELKYSCPSTQREQKQQQPEPQESMLSKLRGLWVYSERRRRRRRTGKDVGRWVRAGERETCIVTWERRAPWGGEPLPHIKHTWFSLQLKHINDSLF